MKNNSPEEYFRYVQKRTATRMVKNYPRRKTEIYRGESGTPQEKAWDAKTIGA